MLLTTLAIGGCVHERVPIVAVSAVKLTPADLSTIRERTI